MMLRDWNFLTMLKVRDSQAPAPKYQYLKLPNGQSIRMLTLFPGAPEDPLRGKLEFFEVGSTIEYEAISYVWGQPNRDSEIKCDCRSLGITTSIAAALLRLRYLDRERRLWADQICINQEDEEERSQQVQFMNKIYENASHVLVWLGRDEHSLAESAFNLVRELDEIFKNEEKREKFRTDHTNDLEKVSKEPWTLLTHITTLPWFTRAWIVQEIGTKAPATLFWGSVAEADWTTLHRVCRNLQDYYHLRMHFHIKTDIVKYSFQRFIEPDKKSRHANRFSFIYELRRARHLHVSDKRDRVFAMLGHYSIRKGENKELRALQADYTKTAKQIYIDVAVRALVGDTSLITLAAVQHSSLPSEMPSWVPDWDAGDAKILSEPISVHCAHGRTSSRLTVDHSTLILSVHGLKLDLIEAVSKPLKECEFYPVSTGEDLAIKALWHDVCKEDRFDLKNKYLNGDSTFFAYVQTLSDGNVSTSSWDPRPYHEIPKSEWLAHGAAYLTMVLHESSDVSEELHEISTKGDHSKWSRAANGASRHRKFARTSKGYFVLGPEVLEVGDIVCVLFGGKTPFCLRPEGGHYFLVGECYVHGLMNGEAMRMLERREVREEVFDIA